MSVNIITKEQLKESFDIITEFQFKQIQGFRNYFDRISREVDYLNQLDFDTNFSVLLDFAKALSSDIRLKILVFIKRVGKTCFCELEQVFDIKQSTLNYHATMLKRANLITTYKEGKLIVLQLSNRFYELLPVDKFPLFGKDS